MAAKAEGSAISPRGGRITGSGDRALTAWKEPDGSGVALYSEGDPLYRAMLDDIAGARERVWMESYIFEDDAVGRPFVEELALCAARGVDVRVRIDAIGSRFGFSDGSARRLGAAGARFHKCRRWKWRRPWTFHRRNHRKLLVVDGRSAYVGGFNISQVSSGSANGEACWRDTHVRLTGPVVQEAASAYAAFAEGDLEWHGDDSRSIYMLTNHAYNCRYRLRCVLRQHLAKARSRIWLTTPYFVADSAMQLQLCAAVARGVDVRVIVAGKTDVRLVQWAARAAYSRLLQEGVRLFEYQPRTLHAKSMLVDDEWSTIGTANFDYRSFFINYELNLVARSSRLNAALAGLFETDMRASCEILARPWASRPALGRVTELIGWSARHWL